MGATIERSTWEVPQIFRDIQRRGRVSDEEMWNTFNMGLGMILVVDRADVPDGALLVGEVTRGHGVTFR